jgi:hypothetical protein
MCPIEQGWCGVYLSLYVHVVTAKKKKKVGKKKSLRRAPVNTSMIPLSRELCSTSAENGTGKARRPRRSNARGARSCRRSTEHLRTTQLFINPRHPTCKSFTVKGARTLRVAHIPTTPLVKRGGKRRGGGKCGVPDIPQAMRLQSGFEPYLSHEAPVQSRVGPGLWRSRR